MHKQVRKVFWRAILLVSATCVSGNWGSAGSRPRGESSPGAPADAEAVSLTEAEILIYLLPQAQSLRSKGMDVGWELQTGPTWKLQDFYAFEVANIKRKNADTASLGFFSVNKHTADVWDDVPAPRLIKADGLELGGVQRILREVHHIDASTMTKYRGLRPQ